MKKDRGDTFNSIIPNLICIIVVMVLIALFTSWLSNIDKRQNINQICRKYMLQMETTGYLTSDMEDSLINELTNAGLRNIEIDSKTSKSKVEYGNDIDLVVKGAMPTFEYNIIQNPEDKIMELDDSNGLWNVFVSMGSISLAQ